MKPETLKLALDKIISAIPDQQNAKGQYQFREQLRKDIKSFAECALQGMLKGVGLYSTNSHSYSEAEAYLIEFRGKV